jgi:16S rRNA (guanine527-N7)-methyltransferase
MTMDPLVDVSRETLRRLEVLIETLGRWQKAINLVGRNTLEGAWKRHIVDSAQVVRLIPTDASSLADLGSGGGFPGLVIAAMRPDLPLTMIESDARKAAFLGEAARKMELPKLPTVVVKRIEAAPPVGADVITARALAPLDQLLEWSDRHRTERATCLFHKGKGWQAEVDEAKKKWDFSPDAIASVTDRDAVILRIGPYGAATDLRDRQPEGWRR